MSRKYIKKIFQPRKKKTHYRCTRKDKPKGKRKTHKDEPILANKRVLRFSIPNQLMLLLGEAATEGTGEETT